MVTKPGEEVQDTDIDVLTEGLEGNEGTVLEIEAVDTKNYTSIADMISSYLTEEIFFFDIKQLTPQVGARGGAALGISDRVSQKYSIKEIMENDDFAPFITDEVAQQYIDIIENGTEDANEKVSDLIIAVDKSINNAPKKTDKDLGDNKILRVEFVKKQTTEVTNLSKEAKSVDIEQISSEQEDIARKKEYADIQNYQGRFSSSGVAWGYTPDIDGYIIGADGEKELAPFVKGSEYRMFTELDQSERFTLQQQMVRAGMEAPPVDEYGQWTDREANFMTAVFIYATDDPSQPWKKDRDNNLPQYTTALEKLGQEIGQTEDFIQLLEEANYLQTKANVSPKQIQDLVEKAAADLGVVLTAQNLVDYGNLAVQSFTQAAALEKQYESSLITDRDLILGSTYKDLEAVQPGEFPRYMKGSSMPLVLPSYEYLMAGKGEQPIVKSALEIATEALAARPEIQQQQAANEDLEDIKYSTNLFEASMGAIKLGDG